MLVFIFLIPPLYILFFFIIHYCSLFSFPFRPFLGRPVFLQRQAPVSFSVFCKVRWFY